MPAPAKVESADTTLTQPTPADQLKSIQPDFPVIRRAEDATNMIADSAAACSRATVMNGYQLTLRP
jgi:hypothetical protein